MSSEVEILPEVLKLKAIFSRSRPLAAFTPGPQTRSRPPAVRYATRLPSLDQTPDHFLRRIKGETRTAGPTHILQPNIDVIGLLIADVHCDPAAIRRKCRIALHRRLAHSPQFFPATIHPSQHRQRRAGAGVVNQRPIPRHRQRHPISGWLKSHRVRDLGAIPGNRGLVAVERRRSPGAAHRPR